MYQPFSNQTIIFFYGIILGIIAAIFYSFFKLIRIVFKFRDWQTFIADIVYFLLNAIFTFIFALTFNFGQIRFFIIISEILGFMIYYFTCGKLLNKIIKKIVPKTKQPHLEKENDSESV